MTIDAELFESLTARRRRAAISLLLVVHAPTPEYQSEQGMIAAGLMAELAITKLLGRSLPEMYREGPSH